MKKIGMIVAIEMNSVHNRYGSAEKIENRENYDLYSYEMPNGRLYVLHCGIGELAAAAGTQFLISRYQVDLIVNFGVVGGLTDEMSKQKVCLVEQVVHHDFDLSEFEPVKPGQYPAYPDVFLPATPELIEKAAALHPELKRVVCASGDQFVGSAEKKKALHERFSADICEMEAAGILLTCLHNAVPCLLVKAVSDGLEGGAAECNRELDRASELCLRIVDEIIQTI